MKKVIKFILGGIVVVAIAGFAMFNMSLNQQNQHLSVLSLAGLLSLSQTETPYSCTVTTNCTNGLGTVTGTVSCTGTICSRSSTWVQCNGNKTNC
jgi:uncharacterized protein YxeA